MKIKYTTIAYLVLNHEQNLEPHVDIFADGTRISRRGKLEFDHVIGDVPSERLRKTDCFIDVPNWLCGLYFIAETEHHSDEDLNLNDMAVKAQCCLVKSFQDTLINGGEDRVRSAMLESAKNLGFNNIEANAFFNGVKEFKEDAVVKSYIDTVIGVAYNEYLEDGKIEGCHKYLYEIVLNG